MNCSEFLYPNECTFDDLRFVLGVWKIEAMIPDELGRKFYQLHFLRVVLMRIHPTFESLAGSDSLRLRPTPNSSDVTFIRSWVDLDMSRYKVSILSTSIEPSNFESYNLLKTTLKLITEPSKESGCRSRICSAYLLGSMKRIL